MSCEVSGSFVKFALITQSHGRALGSQSGLGGKGPPRPILSNPLSQIPARPDCPNLTEFAAARVSPGDQQGWDSPRAEHLHSLHPQPQN